jgi:hypothetical protein
MVATSAKEGAHVVMRKLFKSRNSKLLETNAIYMSGTKLNLLFGRSEMVKGKLE